MEILIKATVLLGIVAAIGSICAYLIEKMPPDDETSEEVWRDW